MELGQPTLTGKLIRLEPLTEDSAAALAEAAKHAEIWRYLDEPTPDTMQAVSDLVEEAIEEQRQGVRVPYVITERLHGNAIGSISFIDIQPRHRGVEIGWAWVTPSHWRTGAAREASYLLMRHAFETAGAIRVVFKTDSRNLRSQRAIERIGATREGVFRNHRILLDGHIRHSIFYSVTVEDWPGVRQLLDSWRESLPPGKAGGEE
ncbi:GNAT family N-acetyltransferase [Micromonospora sp. MMS20-R2-29]|uniref:GNAT family N-acetyltransferase n=2 Tax=Micromonospora humidisoli TaxID=2807622 RepID=A0ABS2J638_9ACTN|nr:GNAT family N-acetyltransferase [Micromonospora humidisoli]